MNRSIQLGCAAILFLTGCASQTGGMVAGDFTSAAELRELKAKPAPADIFSANTKPVDRWELTGPLPARIELLAHREDGPWQRLLETASAKRPGLVFLSEQMHCVARETGLFLLAQKASPEQPLDRFIRSRCGAVTGAGTSAWLTGDVGADETEEAIAKRLEVNLSQLLEKNLSNGNLEAGLWFGRKDKQLVVIASWENRLAQLEPLDVRPDSSGQIILRGEALGATGSVEGLITHGRFGVEDCLADKTVRLPKFAIACPADPADTSASLELLGTAPGRVLGNEIVDLILWPPSGDHKVYVRWQYAAAADKRVGDGSLLSIANQVRADARLGPLTMAPRESATAASIAPLYFAALTGHGPETDGDLIALGLLAGWDVDGGVVRDGRISSTWLSGGVSEDQLLEELLDRPSGRHTLLAPDARQLAVGEFKLGTTLAAIVTTYAFFEAKDYKADELRLLSRIGAQRAARHQAPPKKVNELCDYARKSADLVRAGKASPESALNELGEDVAQGVHRQTHTYEMESMTLESVQLPEEVLDSKAAMLGVAITHYQPAGKAWGRYVVFLVMVDVPDPI